MPDDERPDEAPAPRYRRERRPSVVDFEELEALKALTLPKMAMLEAEVDGAARARRAGKSLGVAATVARAAAALRRKSATMVGSGAGYAPGHAPKLPELKRAQTTGLAAAAAAMRG